MKLRIFNTIAIIILSLNVYSQATFLFTNGKTKEIKDYKLEKDGLIFYHDTKGHYKSIDDYEIFSIINKDEEKVIYKQHGTDEMTIQEMRAFVAGQSDAIKNFKSPLSTIGGVAFGAAAPLVHPTYAIVFSGLYCGGIGATKPLKKKIKIPAEYVNNKHYEFGYKRAANRKRVKNAIIGSLIGLAAGYAGYYAVTH